MSLKSDTVYIDSPAVDIEPEKALRKSKKGREKRQDRLDKSCVQREGRKRGRTGFGPIN